MCVVAWKKYTVYCESTLEAITTAPFIHRRGQINAWDNEELVEAIKDTGRKQLIIAGVVMLHPLLITAIVVALVVVTPAWFVMPWLTRFLRPWPHKK